MQVTLTRGLGLGGAAKRERLGDEFPLGSALGLPHPLTEAALAHLPVPPPPALPLRRPPRSPRAPVRGGALRPAGLPRWRARRDRDRRRSPPAQPRESRPLRAR